MKYSEQIALLVAYEGSAFLGWQATKEGPSVEATLQNRLEIILQHPVDLEAASRTDRGVHALGQVVTFFTSHQLSPERLQGWQYRLNQLLPRSIRIRAVAPLATVRHPSLDAVQKKYRYQIDNQPILTPFGRHTSWHIYKPLNISKMTDGSKLLLGEHDFAAFCNQRQLWNRSTQCTIFDITFTGQGGAQIAIEIIGNHFLYKMVRNIVGTLIKVGLSVIEPLSIQKILHGGKRIAAGSTAPAQGLFLLKVYYAQEWFPEGSVPFVSYRSL